MITEIEDYFTRGCGRCPRFDTPDCATRIWAGALGELRALCLAAGLSEHLKWGHPCYMHAGRNVAILGAFRDNVRLSIFDAALLADPAGILERQGPNTAHPDMIRISKLADVSRLAPTIRAYLAEAMDHARAGRRPPRERREINLPEELIEVLDADPELAEAFHALTPGRQKSYAIHVGGAKKPATRRARIERCRPRILAGKGATER
ncbi:MAG: YdeI/OmpD-associated family protein [Pseudomonadota bacterium]